MKNSGIGVLNCYFLFCVFFFKVFKVIPFFKSSRKENCHICLNVSSCSVVLIKYHAYFQKQSVLGNV